MFYFLHWNCLVNLILAKKICLFNWFSREDQSTFQIRHDVTQLSHGWSSTRSQWSRYVWCFFPYFESLMDSVNIESLTLPTCIMPVPWIKHQTSHQNNKWFGETETSTTLTQHCVGYATTKQIIIKLVSSLSLSWYVI